MSIATQLKRLQRAKSQIRASIEQKGVPVDEELSITYYGAKINEISGGGSGENNYHYVTNEVNMGDRFKNYEFAEITNLIFEILSAGAWYLYGAFFGVKKVKTIKLISPENPTALMTGTNLFRGDTLLESVDLTECNLKFKELSYAFLGDTNLKSILGELDFSECTACAIWLNGCSALQDISFIKESINISISFEWCPLLSDASIQSIIDGLADLTGGTAQTLTLHAEVGAKLTDEQKATITAKNWTLVY